METIVKEISQKLEKIATPAVKDSNLRFFKNEIKLHGVRSSDSGRVSKEYLKEIKNLPKDQFFNICESLWKTGYLEETCIAGGWAYHVHDQYEESDIYTFEKWVDKYVNNWASCDNFCNHAVGELVVMYPKNISVLKQWCKSKNIWLKRASAVSLIIPARKGLFLKDIFEIADTLLLDSNDMVQKGYGWMLKAASESHEREVFDYVMKHKTLMPRTSLRYAIEKMPKELKMKAMER